MREQAREAQRKTGSGSMIHSGANTIASKYTQIRITCLYPGSCIRNSMCMDADVFRVCHACQALAQLLTVVQTRLLVGAGELMQGEVSYSADEHVVHCSKRMCNTSQTHKTHIFVVTKSRSKQSSFSNLHKNSTIMLALPLNV